MFDSQKYLPVKAGVIVVGVVRSVGATDAESVKHIL